MQYLGGKSKISKFLLAAMRPVLRPPGSAAAREWWEPFCGGLSVSCALAEVGPGLVTDANPALIATYRAVVAGWDPPSSVSEDEYRAARSLPDDDPRKAIAGFGCSFGGKWFAGYARSGGRSFAAGARDALLRDVGALVRAGCVLARVDFLEMSPDDVDPEDAPPVIYADPPYRGTEPYGALAPFDHDRFYERVRQWSRVTDVFVSEYAMPAELGGRLALEFHHDMSVAGGAKKGARVERLYHYSPDLPTLARRRRDCPLCK